MLSLLPYAVQDVVSGSGLPIKSGQVIIFVSSQILNHLASNVDLYLAHPSQSMTKEPVAKSAFSTILPCWHVRDCQFRPLIQRHFLLMVIANL